MPDNTCPVMFKGLLANEGVDGVASLLSISDRGYLELPEAEGIPTDDAASTMGDLHHFIKQEYNNLPKADICKRVYSMRRRCQQCRDNRGGYTEY